MSLPASHGAPQRALDSGFGEFFRYHGWLAPGIRLFRRLSFPGKAAWVSVAFMIPLVVLMAYLWRDTQNQVHATRMEQDGLQYVRTALDLLRNAQARRLAAVEQAPDLAQLQQQVQGSFDKLEAAQRQYGDNFRTAESFEKLRALHGPLQSQPTAGSADETFERQDAYVAALLTLVREITDGSGLILDPEGDTYHMVAFSLVRGPRQYENTARLLALGHLVLSSQQMTPERRTRIDEWQTMQQYLDDDVENEYAEGIEAFPAVATQFDMKGTDAASDAFRAAIGTQLMGESLKGSAAEFQQLGQAAVDKQAALCAAVAQRLQERLQARIDGLWHTFYLELGMSLLCLAIAGYLLLAFYRVMMGGLREVSEHLRQITQGNLTTAPTPWGKDEAAQLMTTLGEMQTSLRRIVATVLQGSATVQTASREIASASQDLSQRTEQNAANLQETAASMAQIAESVKSAAQHVHTAASSASANAEAAQRGGEAISEVVRTMEDIQTASSKIGEIIGVIDGIAFQTNILALNAAVEAARAGEQGRGFAVVASEVRALAGRSATAAREIKSLIQSSIEKVESGTQVVTRAGEIMQDVVSNAGQASGLMGTLADSARSQSRSIGEVESAVQALDSATQQNAALVEQTTSAATALADSAHQLSQEVSFFKLA